MEKINIAELLRNCPKGMELNCMIYEDIYFDYVDELNIIHCYIQNEGFKTSITFNQHGTLHSDVKSKCVIFPKDKTTWEGFVPPCQFKDGDVLFIDCADKESDKDLYKYIFILKEIDSLGHYFSYCHLSIDGFFPSINYLTDNKYTPRFATEEEKQKLFDVIKENGYRWNAETKTLKKLPKFKVGDKIKKYECRFIIAEIKDNYYLTKCGNKIYIDNQDEFSLVPDKFDITTLKPFDKVLVRDNETHVWCADFYSHYNNNKPYKYVCVGGDYKQCIPYNDETANLVNNTNDYNEYYKTWEK